MLGEGWRGRLGGMTIVVFLVVERERRSSAAKRMKACPSEQKGRTKFVSWGVVSWVDCLWEGRLRGVRGWRCQIEEPCQRGLINANL